MSKKGLYISLICVSFVVIGIYILLFFSYILYPLKYKEQIINYSIKYNVKSEVVASVINAESNFNPSVVSSRGAVGLMQLMPSTAEWLSERIDVEYSYQKLFDVDFNIMLGTYYLSYLSDKFDNQTVVLCAYNAGEGVVKNWLNDTRYSKDGKTLDQIPYSQTKSYVDKINSIMKIYNKKLS